MRFFFHNDNYRLFHSTCPKYFVCDLISHLQVETELKSVHSTLSYCPK